MTKIIIHVVENICVLLRLCGTVFDIALVFFLKG